MRVNLFFPRTVCFWPLWSMIFNNLFIPYYMFIRQICIHNWYVYLGQYNYIMHMCINHFLILLLFISFHIHAGHNWRKAVSYLARHYPPLSGPEYRSVTFLILARNMGFAQILARKLVFLLNFSPDIGFFNDFSFARKFGFCLDFRVRFKYSGRSWEPFF